MDAMNNSYEDHVVNVFERFGRRVIENASKDFERKRQKRSREVALPEAGEEIPSALLHNDQYTNDGCFEFRVLKYVVYVQNEHLANALDSLPERKRNVVLLYYFLGMTDEQIGETLKTLRTTVNKIRNKSIQELENLIGDSLFDD